GGPGEGVEGGRSAAVPASSSLYIYLTHWQVYPHLYWNHSLLAVLASLAVGIAYWMVATRVMAKLSSVRRRPRRKAGAAALQRGGTG
ncbi:hypothetical protein, partial [Planosporangium flavigriseum]